MQEFQDINTVIEPDEVSYWPLQPGWYIVFGIFLIVLFLFILKRYNKWLRHAYKREAISKILEIPNTSDFFYHLNVILKSVAIQKLGRVEVASLSDTKWSRFLNKSTAKEIFSDKVLLAIEHSNYEAKDVNFDDSLIQQAKNDSIQWVKDF